MKAVADQGCSAFQIDFDKHLVFSFGLVREVKLWFGIGTQRSAAERTVEWFAEECSTLGGSATGGIAEGQEGVRSGATAWVRTDWHGRLRPANVAVDAKLKLYPRDRRDWSFVIFRLVVFDPALHSVGLRRYQHHVPPLVPLFHDEGDEFGSIGY